MSLKKWVSHAGSVVTGSLVLFCSVGPGNATGNELSRILGAYECSLAGLIARIHAYPNPDDYQNRFIVVDSAANPSGYVQCAFDHRDREALCEAASGFYAAPGETPQFAPDSRAALARLGFSLDGQHGNFGKRLRFSPEVDPDSLARFMLTALHDGFGANEYSVLQVQAPDAMPHGILPKAACPQIS